MYLIEGQFNTGKILMDLKRTSEIVELIDAGVVVNEKEEILNSRDLMTLEGNIVVDATMYKQIMQKLDL